MDVCRAVCLTCLTLFEAQHRPGTHHLALHPTHRVLTDQLVLIGNPGREALPDGKETP